MTEFVQWQIIGSKTFWNKGNYLQWFLTAAQINFPREHRALL